MNVKPWCEMTEECVGKMREVFLDTLEYYNSPEKFGYKGTACVYYDPATGNKCALGRYLKDAEGVASSNVGTLGAVTVLDRFELKDHYSDIPEPFWVELQRLHDQAANKYPHTLKSFVSEMKRKGGNGVGKEKFPESLVGTFIDEEFVES